ALEKAQINREALVDLGLEFNRRRHGQLYFISNWSAKQVEAWVPLTTATEQVAIFDPMSGEFGRAKTRIANGQTEVYLQLNQGTALILQSFEGAINAEDWLYFKKKAEPLVLDKNWNISFATGGPQIPEDQALAALDMWTNLDGAAFQHFSGTGIYSTTFSKPSGEGGGWLLDLGEVAESATVRLNGTEIGTAIGPVYQLYIPQGLLQETNRLEVAVSNSMANRVISLEQQGQRWQRFYNINISARLLENLGPDRVFTTKKWSPRPSGLAGPVTLTLME
ncbi:MAG: hypothetical protein KDC44_10075, partial [Phaeodactylibacter sp.]|nr:hypothetical protein [Phaeodactylibacter sp.]